MNSVTSNSSPDEGIAFEIPQLDDGGLSGRAPAAASKAGTADAGGPRRAPACGPTALTPQLVSVPVSLPRDVPVAPRRSVASTILASLKAAEARAARAEGRALRAEPRLARHQRHCICRSALVADAVDAEAQGSDVAEAAAEPGAVGLAPAAAGALTAKAAEPAASPLGADGEPPEPGYTVAPAGGPDRAAPPGSPRQR